MLDARSTAANVAAEHEWWKGSVAGPLTTASVGRWRTEMPTDVQRFAALHLAGFLRRYGYEGAHDPRRVVGVVPVADAVGPANEHLLLDLARRDAIVARPAPRTPAELHRQADLAFVGVRGQLDPCRGQGAARRVVSVAALAGGLLVRRLQRRPILWVRQATLRRRRPNDAAEAATALLLRALARQLTVGEAAARLGGDGQPTSLPPR
jgi:hypothetical protein